MPFPPKKPGNSGNQGNLPIGGESEGGGFSGNPPRRFNVRVTAYQQVLVSDDKGGSTESWDPLTTVWGFVRRMTLREEAEAARMGLEASWTVTVRLSSLTTGWTPRRTRLTFTDQFGDHTLVIQRLLPANLLPGGLAQANLQLVCEEVF